MFRRGGDQRRDSGRAGGREAARPGGRDAEFTAWASAAAPRLRDTAYLLSRDWHLADDLTQTTLTKMYLAWGRASAADNLAAYAHTVLTRTFLDHRRRRSSGEVVTDALPEHGSHTGPELRLTLLDALARLAPPDRTVVVLRYWEDHSVEQTAEILGISAGAVKTRSLRALARLRGVLDVELTDLTG